MCFTNFISISFLFAEIPASGKAGEPQVAYELGKANAKDLVKTQMPAE